MFLAFALSVTFLDAFILELCYFIFPLYQIQKSIRATYKILNFGKENSSWCYVCCLPWSLSSDDIHAVYLVAASGVQHLVPTAEAFLCFSFSSYLPLSSLYSPHQHMLLLRCVHTYRWCFDQTQLVPHCHDCLSLSLLFLLFPTMSHSALMFRIFCLLLWANEFDLGHLWAYLERLLTGHRQLNSACQQAWESQL